MMALRATGLGSLPERVQRPGYDRGRVSTGIAHLSVGNFHRAHQAVYVDRCLALPGHEGWGILGIGLIDSPGERAKAEGMAAQDGLYTLSLFPPQAEPTFGVVGSIVDYLFAPADPEAALVRLADPAIRIVSLTITEGGYNLDEATGEFLLDAPDVAHDLAHPEAPRTAFGFIVGALAGRRASGHGPLHRPLLRQSPPQRCGRPQGRARLRAWPAIRTSPTGSPPTSPFPAAWSTASPRPSPRPTWHA